MPNNNYPEVSTIEYRSLASSSLVNNNFTSLTTWGTQTALDLVQLIKDIHGSGYILDQDGLANLAAPLRNYSDGISSLTWKFTGSLTLPSTLYVDQTSADYTITFNNPTQSQQIIFDAPVDTPDYVTYLFAPQTLYSKVLDNPIVNNSLLVRIDGDLTNTVLLTNQKVEFSWSGTPQWRNQLNNIATPPLRWISAGGGEILSLTQTGELTLNSHSTSNAAIHLNAALNKDSDIYFKENGVQKWVAHNNFNTDDFHIRNIDNKSILNLTQSGDTTVNGGLAGDATYFTVDTPTDTYAAYRLFENGSQKWVIQNNPTTDDLEIANVGGGVKFRIDQGTDIYANDINNRSIVFNDGAGSDWTIIGLNINNRLSYYYGNTLVSSYEETGELLLPDIDTPTANCGNRNSFVKAFLNYIDGSGSVAGSYNIDSVSGDDGSAGFDINIDTNFASVNWSCTGNANSGIRPIVQFSSFAAGSVHIDMIRATDGVALETDFTFMACGRQ